MQAAVIEKFAYIVAMSHRVEHITQHAYRHTSTAVSRASTAAMESRVHMPLE